MSYRDSTVFISETQQRFQANQLSINKNTLQILQQELKKY